MRLNENYKLLKENYLFIEIAKRVKDYKQANPDKYLYRLGIGDVTLPLVPAVIEALHLAVSEMGEKVTFRGYGHEQGYSFLRSAICGYYENKGVSIMENEVFISDGAKSDIGNILEIFGKDNTVLIPDPVYPVYVETNIMAGNKIVFINATPEKKFIPLPDYNIKADIIYICSPDNPTGTVFTKEQLTDWVNYALDNNAIIIFDSAYEKYIVDKTYPSSIFQIEGAKKCAIEFCSLSKTAGFTGTRCGYTIIPMELLQDGQCVNKMWLRRQTTKFNGVPYIVQRGAEAVFSEKGLSQINESIEYYLQNAKIIAKTLDTLNIWYTGGKNSPYIWLKCPDGMSSWEFFDHLLNNVSIVGSPGIGFGQNGEGFFRLTAFADRQNIIGAMYNFSKLY